MRGVSVIVKNEGEFLRMKEHLGSSLYLDWVPQMGEVETAVVVDYNGEDFSVGSVGSAEYQRKNNIRTISFNSYLPTTWNDLWEEFMETKEFKDSHRSNYASNYVKWLQKNYNPPIKK